MAEPRLQQVYRPAGIGQRSGTGLWGSHGRRADPWDGPLGLPRPAGRSLPVPGGFPGIRQGWAGVEL